MTCSHLIWDMVRVTGIEGMLYVREGRCRLKVRAEELGLVEICGRLNEAGLEDFVGPSCPVADTAEWARCPMSWARCPMSEVR